MLSVNSCLQRASQSKRRLLEVAEEKQFLGTNYGVHHAQGSQVLCSHMELNKDVHSFISPASEDIDADLRLLSPLFRQ